MPSNKQIEIVTAAIQLFQQKGYHATSMQDIADAVGLQKGSLYHYITSKDDLLVDMMRSPSTTTGSPRSGAWTCRCGASSNWP